VHFDAELAEPPHVDALVDVVADDARTQCDERLRRRLSGASEPDDEDAPAREVGQDSMNSRKSR
jgi:hypothetical protein